MNKAGQMAFVGMMLGVMLLIGAVVLIEPIKEQVTFARNSDNLDCDNAAISTGTAMTCIIVDWYMPIFVGVALTISFAWVGLRNLRQGASG